MWYCGWDGGGTKTEVLVADSEGTTLHRQVFGPLNPNGSSPEQVRNTVREAVSFLRAMPGGEEACGGMVIGAAGISSRNTAGLLEEALREAGWSRPYRLAGDQEIALAGAIEGHGAILIAGTGSICYGRDPGGRLFRTGGYGHLIDDEGSGYALGRDILKAVVRAADGRGPETVLTSALESALHLSAGDVPGIITWLYAPERAKAEVAALARLLTPALEANDPAALAIAENAAENLAELVLTGWRKTGMTDGELALTGSILQKFPVIRNTVIRRVNDVYPAVQCGDPRGTPARGAVRMAAEPVNGCFPFPPLV